MSIIHCRRLLGAAAIALAAGAASCIPLRTAPIAPLTQLVVRNGSFFDVNVSIVTSPGARPSRIGTVVSATNATFPLSKGELQYGAYLVVQLHAIGARESWTTEPYAVDNDVVAVIDVHADPFGDCSQSAVRLVAVSDLAHRVVP